jgi:hypothetical protein
MLMKLTLGVDFTKVDRMAYGVKRKSGKVQQLRQSVNFIFPAFHQPIFEWRTYASSGD